MHTFTPNTVTESAKVNANFAGLADGTEISDQALLPRHFSDSAIGGWFPVGDTPDTITYNGNRSYTLVFNTNDLTDTLSEGMRLKFTRTVSAPTQCTDLEASSSQYWNDTTLTGITFTDDFVAGAWVKLESYALGGIISRFNGTSGWILLVLADGRVQLNGYNAGAANVSTVTSYASLPLGRWVHVAAQLDMSAFTATTTTSYIMLDGLDVTATVTRGGTNPTALVQAGNLEVGSYNAGSFFDGKIMQAFVSSAKITQANVRTLISQGLTAALVSSNSIASAYSFDGNATDINTTNANNLTGQNGAVATNVDSAFGDYLGGLLDFGIITECTFSTNTTVTVQVPEGCAIPTSGGLSAVAYSSYGIPYGFPGVSNLISYQELRNNFTTTSTTATQVLGLGKTINVPINREIKITFKAPSTQQSINTSGTFLTLWSGTVGSGTLLGYSKNDTDLANYQNSVEVIAYLKTTSNTITINAGYHIASAGTATLSTSNAGTSGPIFLAIELVPNQ